MLRESLASKLFSSHLSFSSLSRVCSAFSDVTARLFITRWNEETGPYKSRIMIMVIILLATTTTTTTTRDAWVVWTLVGSNVDAAARCASANDGLAAARKSIKYANLRLNSSSSQLRLNFLVLLMMPLCGCLCNSAGKMPAQSAWWCARRQISVAEHCRCLAAFQRYPVARWSLVRAEQQRTLVVIPEFFHAAYVLVCVCVCARGFTEDILK